MPKRPSPNFADMDLAEISRLLADNAVSSTELVEFYLDRISRLDSKLHAFAQVFDSAARRAAEAADLERLAGRATGPLHGIPIAVKDVFHCSGSPTRAGSHAYAISPTEKSATAVRHLESAGMIVLGKTHTNEFAYGAWGVNTVAGTPWNPWDLETHRAPGGSSSGSAVAVAAGLVPAALGSDTGGSCRVPAAFCGCFGLKPSYGLIGRSGMVPLSPTFDVPGLLTRSTEDTAMLMDVLIGPDPGDPATQHTRTNVSFHEVEAGINGFRIGRLSGRDLEGVDREVLGLYERALEDLESLGAIVADFRMPHPFEYYLNNTVRIINAEIGANFGHLAEIAGSEIQPFVKERMSDGMKVSAEEYAGLLENRTAAQAEMSAAMGGIDAVATPTCPGPAIPVADVDVNVAATPYARLVNYLNMAGLSVPYGHTNSGLPAAVQIMVQRFEDPSLLRLGRALETANGRLVTTARGFD